MRTIHVLLLMHLIREHRMVEQGMIGMERDKETIIASKCSSKRTREKKRPKRNKWHCINDCALRHFQRVVINLISCLAGRLTLCVFESTLAVCVLTLDPIPNELICIILCRWNEALAVTTLHWWNFIWILCRQFTRVLICLKNKL